MTEEMQIDECFNCKKKKDISDNWRTCKLKCSYKYKRKENDYITRLEQENKELNFKKNQLKANSLYNDLTGIELSAKVFELEQENKELKEWKTKVVMLFKSACRCKYLNEETDICSYTNEKCININKCVYKYQELSSNYRSALEEIRILATKNVSIENFVKIQNKINKIL